VPVSARAGDETLARATTGPDGRFALEVPAASFSLVAAPAAHERLDVKVEARPGEEREETFYLESAATGFETVVRAKPVQREVTKQVIPAEVVAKTAGTQGDTLGAVLNLPGVARSSFGGVSLVLRGSAPGDSRVFLAGQEIPLLYHFGGLRSTFNPRFLDAVEFVPGNFSVEYGRAIGGIIDVRVRDPADDLFRGEAGVNFYDGGFALEGPLGGGWSGGAAFHRSWIDTLLPLVLPSDAGFSFDTAPRYYDYQFVASRKLEGGGRARVFWYGSLDKLVLIFDRPQDDPKIAGQISARTMFHALQAEVETPLGPRLRQATSLQLSLAGFRTRFGNEFYFDLDVLGASLRSALTYTVGPTLSARAGIDAGVSHATISANVPQVPKEGEPQPPVSTLPTTAGEVTQRDVQPGIWADLRWEPLPGVAVVPGIRADWYRTLSRWTVDPRLSARWDLSRLTALKAGVGLFQQPPAPDESAPPFGTSGLLAPRALHVSAGGERRFGFAEIDLTGFWKSLDRLVVRNPLSAVSSSAPIYVNDGTGRIYGAEVLLKAKGERAFGWIAYTYQRSFRTDGPGQPERRFDFDQPHIFTAVGTWMFARAWSAGFRYRFVSGNPTTPVDGSIFDATSGVYVPIYGAVNAERLPAFSQVDVRVDRTWTYPRWKLSAFLDVQNATNRGNVEGYTYSFDYAEKAKLTGLPILPILGVEGAW
jgi:hypothetical protein